MKITELALNSNHWLNYSFNVL